MATPDLEAVEDPLSPEDVYVTMRYQAMARAVHEHVANSGTLRAKLTDIEVSQLCIAVGSAIEKLSRVRTMEQLDEAIMHANEQAAMEGASPEWGRIAIEALQAKAAIYRMIP